MGKDVTGFGISKDFYNVSRPIGVNPDIGAFQFNINSSLFPNHFDSSIYLYPNPNNGKFMVVNNENDSIKKITIYSINGLNLYQQNPLNSDSFTVNITDKISSGIYIFSIETTSKKFNYPLVIR